MANRILVPLLILAALAPAYPQDAVDRSILRTLRAGHPRIMMLDSDLARVRANVKRDPLARKWLAGLRRQAERMLTEPPVRHELIGPRLLDKSRRGLDRVTTLAFLYRLEGDRRFAERARTELLTVAAFPDWNPSHFLDVAEMSHAVAIGYDWLHEFLSPDDLRTLRAAIVKLGLNPSLDKKYTWWKTVSHNWNQVCNGGLTIAALAIADEEPDFAANVVSHAIESVKLAMASYASDGGWPEGPGYWNYATTYNVYMLAALESALGTCFGLDRAKGFAETGVFPLYFDGPIGRTFNFADAGDREGGAPCLFWLARHFHKPLYAWMERQIGRGSADDLLWFDTGGDAPSVPPSAWFKGVNVAFLRSSWDDTKATFVGFKGGDNAANHSHLDLGSFVLDADGERWAVDLGGDDYNLPGYFGQRRFRYYRTSTAGHNTLQINGQNQETKAKARITEFSADRKSAFAVADLSTAYAGVASKVVRKVSLVNGRDVQIEDEIGADAPVDVVWAMHTPASVAVDGPAATLTLDGKKLTATILSPPGARFETTDANPPAPQAQNPGITKLLIRLSSVTKAKVVVRFHPGP